MVRMPGSAICSCVILNKLTNLCLYFLTCKAEAIVSLPRMGLRIRYPGLRTELGAHRKFLPGYVFRAANLSLVSDTEHLMWCLVCMGSFVMFTECCDLR